MFDAVPKNKKRQYMASKETSLTPINFMAENLNLVLKEGILFF